MKKITSFAAVTLGLMLTAACSDSDNDFNNGYLDRGNGTAPTVVSVSPEDNASELDTIKTIVVVYDKPIAVTPHASIKINTEYVADSAITVRGDSLIFTYDTKGNTTYKVTIMKPTVRDAEYNFASDYTFSFSTAPVNMFDPTLFTLDQSPVDANATEPTKKLYAYLLSQFGQKTLSGAMANVNWNTENAEKMYQMSGKYPAINCFDFIHFMASRPLGSGSWIDYTNTTVAEQWWEQNGIVAAMWHWLVPVDKNNDTGSMNDYTYGIETNFSAKNVTRKNTFERTRAERDLGIIADYLLALQAKGIPVLWRPLHEAAGNTLRYTDGKAWFWWGADGSTQYKKLWKFMYEFFQEKGVHNLIWVWTSETGDDAWYPGDEYVDIIARDYYESDESLFHEPISAQFANLREIGGGKKMVTLAECGAIPDITQSFQAGDGWSWFMPWYQDQMGEPYNSESFFNTLLNSKSVITRDEVPSLK